MIKKLTHYIILFIASSNVMYTNWYFFLTIIMISSFLAPIANDKMNECHIYNWHINEFKIKRTYVYMYQNHFL